MNGKKIYAIMYLGFFFFLHILIRIGKLFTGRANGFARFRRYYLEDHIMEFTPEDRARLVSFERCINCGMCAYRCELHKTLSRKVFTGMNVFAPAQSKSAPEAWTAKDLVDAVDKETLKSSLKCCDECIGCENICPNEVPLTQMLRFVDEKLREGLHG